VFKRITWMGIGMAVGATGAFRAKRKVEATIDRYLPEQVADRAAASARGVGHVVRAAAQEGRDVMRATESELRARVEARTYVGDRPVQAGTAALGPAAAAGGTGGPPGPRRQSRTASTGGQAPTGRRRSRR
jgi:hypothetical protein